MVDCGGDERTYEFTPEGAVKFHAMLKRNKTMKSNRLDMTDWKEIHEILRCKGCKFAKRGMVNKGACCTITWAKQDPETDTCLSREEKRKWWKLW